MVFVIPCFAVSFAARLVTHENEHLNFKSRQCMCWLVPVPNRALRGKVSKTQRVEGRVTVLLMNPR